MQAMDEFDKSKKMVVLIIDEAQVLATAEHSVFAHALRAALDIRKERLTVLFAGSSETTLRRMFGRVSEPFYNWAALEFTKAKVFNDGEFENQWQHLLPTDQLLLTLIAHDATDLQGREVRNTVGASWDLKSPSPQAQFRIHCADWLTRVLLPGLTEVLTVSRTRRLPTGCGIKISALEGLVGSGCMLHWCALTV